jgi:hypothetical protein
MLVMTALLQPASARAADPADAAAPGTHYRLRVHLLSPDDGVELRRIVGHQDLVVCKAPCDKVVGFHPYDEFVLDGPGLRRSLHFQLPERDGDAAFRVSPGYAAPQLAGGAIFAVGAATFLYAGQTFLLGSMFSGTFCDGDPTCNPGDQSRNRTAGTIALVGLAAAIIGGAWAIWGSPPTRIAAESAAQAK